MELKKNSVALGRQLDNSYSHPIQIRCPGKCSSVRIANATYTDCEPNKKKKAHGLRS